MKEDANLKLIKKMRTRNGTGWSMSSWKLGTYVITRYPIPVLDTLMKTLPRLWMSLPMPWVMKKLPEFFRARTHAYIADAQNVSPVRTTMT
jgi:hypothetical protein